MKKVLFIAATALLCILISCNDTETKATTDADKQAKNKADFEMIYHALETGDVSQLDSIIDKDIVDNVLQMKLLFINRLAFRNRQTKLQPMVY